VNVKDRDVFHLPIEDYLLGLISAIDELARLARNAVTVGDYRRPVEISRFVKDVHAGFQILNLKNDILRKRSDGIKYRVGFSSNQPPWREREVLLTVHRIAQGSGRCRLRLVAEELAAQG
jgi:hypothetical protein